MLENMGKPWENVRKHWDKRWFHQQKWWYRRDMYWGYNRKGKKKTNHLLVLSEQLDSCYKHHELVRYVYHRPQFA
jgi:hypothetical protein